MIRTSRARSATLGVRGRALRLLVILGLGCSSDPIIGLAPPALPLGEPPPVVAPRQVDVVLQVIEPAVDVLWVIDNSGSMEGERDLLATAFPGFVAPFVDAAVDYHIGVITMDMGRPTDQGRLREASGLRWLDRDTPDLQGTFAAMATAALAPGDKKLSDVRLQENGRDAIFAALHTQSGAGGHNEGFLHDRDSAWLHLTVVSDEDDKSTRLSVPEFVSYLEALRSLPARVSFNSIVALATVGRAERGEDYLAVTDAIGGTAASLLDQDWPDLLSELGALQAPAPATEFFLSRLPEPATLQVRAVTDRGVTLVFLEHRHYIYDAVRNSVMFDPDEAPPTGSRVEMDYAPRQN